jgi:hypothetical protein
MTPRGVSCHQAALRVRVDATVIVPTLTDFGTVRESIGTRDKPFELRKTRMSRRDARICRTLM